MLDKMDSEKQPLTQSPVTQEQSFLLKHVGLLARLWGLATLAVIWAAAVTLLQGQYVDAPAYAPYYLLTVGIMVTFFELTWVLDKMACCVREGMCCKIWFVILWVDKWRKFIFYTGLSVPLFLQGVRLVISIISGFCLLVLACLYLVKSFSNMRKVRGDNAETKSSSAAVRHEVSTQTEQVSKNPFEDEEWSEEETPLQRRQREQEQQRRKQQREEEERRQRLEELERREEEYRRRDEQRRQEEARRQEELKRQEEQRRQDELKRQEEELKPQEKEMKEQPHEGVVAEPKQKSRTSDTDGNQT